MTSMDDLNAAEWRALGVYYDRDDESHEWRLLGSRAGFATFAAALSAYADDVKNEPLSEHEHMGPHMYLKVMSDVRAAIAAGTFAEFHREFIATFKPSGKILEQRKKVLAAE